MTGLAVGDLVVSTFFPDWSQGDAPLASFARTPGDGIDGYGVETVVRPANWFAYAPRNWSCKETATLPTAGLTAWRALVVEGHFQAGQDVLVLGTGGVSIFALQFAKQMGGRVIVTSSSDEKLERARGLGADYGVNYLRDENWSSRVMDLTKGRGVDLVVETSGPGTLPQSIQATRIGGAHRPRRRDDRALRCGSNCCANGKTANPIWNNCGQQESTDRNDTSLRQNGFSADD